MARQIIKYPLADTAPVQSVDMPRRARVIHVSLEQGVPALFAEVLVDADTTAFDVKHLRHFAVVCSGGTVPEGAGYVGSCASKVGLRHVDYHIYEIRSPQAVINPRGS